MTWQQFTLRGNPSFDREPFAMDDEEAAESINRIRRDTIQARGFDYRGIWCNRFSIITDTPELFIAIRGHSSDDGWVVEVFRKTG